MSKSVKSKATNVLVWVLMAMLVLGLAGFGVTNFGGQVRAVGTVGQTVIDANQYGRALQQRMEAISQQTGEEMGIDQAEAIGLTQAVLQQMIAEAALVEAARLAGLSAPDDAVGAEIQRIAAFQGPDGNFDREAYAFTLDRSGLTPAAFEDSVRRDIASGLLQRALLTGLTPPASYGDSLFNYVAETRDIAWAEYSAALLDTPPAAPSEAEVAAFYETNPELFSLPPRKEISFAWLSPDMLADQVKLSEADLQALYAQEAARFNQPERRMLSRLGFASLEAAEAAKAAIAAGETDFDALIAERGLAEADVDMGVRAQSELSAEAGPAVFALDDTGVTDPVESAIGPALFRVNAILEGRDVSFDEARPQLEALATAEAAQRLVDEEIEALDDLLAGGATLEELAQDSAMELGQITLPADMIAQVVPISLPEFLNAADALSAEDFPEIILAEGGVAFAMRLDQTLEAALQPLEAVEAEAAALAQAEATRAALRAKAEADLARLAEGESLADLGLDLQQAQGLTRQQPPLDLPVPILTALYEMEAGAVDLVDGEGQEVYLLRVDTVTPPDRGSAQASAILRQLNNEAARGMVQDVLSQFSRHVAESEGIQLNQTAINAVHAALR